MRKKLRFCVAMSLTVEDEIIKLRFTLQREGALFDSKAKDE